jgi:hypothetical protein
MIASLVFLPLRFETCLRMPNVSGFELLSIVRRRFPQVPVIATSGEYNGITNTCPSWKNLHVAEFIAICCLERVPDARVAPKGRENLGGRVAQILAL